MPVESFEVRSRVGDDVAWIPNVYRFLEGGIYVAPGCPCRPNYPCRPNGGHLGADGGEVSVLEDGQHRGSEGRQEHLPASSDAARWRGVINLMSCALSLGTSAADACCPGRAVGCWERAAGASTLMQTTPSLILGSPRPPVLDIE
jgi:hypothetical protein